MDKKPFKYFIRLSPLQKITILVGIFLLFTNGLIFEFDLFTYVMLAVGWLILLTSALKIEKIVQNASPRIKRTVKIILGSILLILGIIGWLIPVIPGWPLLVPGVLMIAPEQGKKILEKLKKIAQRNL